MTTCAWRARVDRLYPTRRAVMTADVPEPFHFPHFRGFVPIAHGLSLLKVEMCAGAPELPDRRGLSARKHVQRSPLCRAQRIPVVMSGVDPYLLARQRPICMMRIDVLVLEELHGGGEAGRELLRMSSCMVSPKIC